MKKIIVLLLSLISLNCYGIGWLNFESLEKCLIRHQEAFKKFEPEASQVKVSTDVKHRYEGTYTTYTYSPKTPHLSEYLSASKALMHKLKTTAVTKGILMGLLLGLVNAKVFITDTGPLAQLKNIFGNSLLLTMVINPILTSLGCILLENKSVQKPEPYFALEDLEKGENLFSINSKTMERIMTASSVTFPVQLFSTLLFAGVLARLQKYGS